MSTARDEWKSSFPHFREDTVKLVWRNFYKNSKCLLLTKLKTLWKFLEIFLLKRIERDKMPDKEVTILLSYEEN